MNKSEYLWVAIRIFGIYLLVLGLKEIPTVIGAVYFSFSGMFSTSELEGASQIAQMNASVYKAYNAQAFTSAIRLIFMVSVAYYFCRHAKWLHKTMMRSDTNEI